MIFLLDWGADTMDATTAYKKMLTAWANEDIPQAKAMAVVVREHVVQGHWPAGVEQFEVVNDLYTLTGRS